MTTLSSSPVLAHSTSVARTDRTTQLRSVLFEIIDITAPLIEYGYGIGYLADDIVDKARHSLTQVGKKQEQALVDLTRYVTSEIDSGWHTGSEMEYALHNVLRTINSCQNP